MESKQGDESPAVTDDDVFPANFAEIVASLPRGPPCSIFPSVRLYRGFWVPTGFLLNLPRAHALFVERRPADILLASFPKSGTTWLKALAFATARRSVHSPLNGAAGHPLLSSSSHNCVALLDILGLLESNDDDGNDDTMAPPPRLLSTHLPYSLLPRRATADGGGGNSSGCRFVYIARDPKDTLVSAWHFDAGLRRSAAAEGREGGGGAGLEFEEAFELYCQGHGGMAPQWEHVREYWEASKRTPGSVLFLRYEEMLQDPEGNLKKMAEFMGCPFSAAEDDAGVVRAIVELCSLEKQRSLAVNITGAYANVLEDVVVTTAVENKYFFRKGIVGDWRNHMTPEMAARLDGIVEEALKASGFTFGVHQYK
ncbi:hypothetical protein BDA96_04G051000 [Sorghum bicolor]|uniref:Sulfotransferase n=3 Tax=Sorghum bicolor TaxID=4558 RepID=C5XVB6_SORBI|nr:hypothetical protein SORBI_3004G046100 [Sorghum bicolor]KAG0531772.1 hypothetical protein BDA96_04G051000 [Sorghum bicolor]